MAWHGMAWHGMAWHGMACTLYMAWHGMARHVHGMPWHGMAWHGVYMARTSKADVLQRRGQDESFAQCFSTARAILEDKRIAEFRLAEVCSDTRMGTRTSRHFQGWTKAQYEAFYGKDPASVGHKPVELRDELGDSFHCYLVEKPGPRDITIFCDSFSRFTDFHQTADRSIHADQGKLTFQHMSADPKTSVLRKVAKAKSHEDIQAVIAKLKEQEKASRVHSAPSSENSGASDDEEGQKNDDAIRTRVGLPPPVGVPMAASMVGSIARAAALSPAPQAGGEVVAPVSTVSPMTPTTTSATPAPPSAAGSVRGVGSTSTRLPRCEAPFSAEKLGPARTVDEHIQRLPLVGVLSGQKVGMERRWAQKFYDDHHESIPDCELLKSHMAALDSAMALAGGAAIKMPRSTLESHAKLLKAHGVDYPTKVKRDLVERRFLLWAASPDRFDAASTRDLLGIIAPWDPASVSQEFAQERDSFEPLEASMSRVEGSVQDKAREFKHTLVKRVLVASIKGDSEWASGTETLCDVVLQFLEGVTDDVDEGYGECIFELLRIFRSIHSILKSNLCGATTQSDIEWLRDQGSSKSSEKVGAVVAATVLQSPYYLERLDNLERWGASTLQFKPLLDKTLAELKGASLDTEVDVVTRAVDACKKMEGKVAPATTTLLTEAIGACASRIADTTKGLVEQQKPFSQDVLAMLEAVAAVVGQDSDRNSMVQRLRAVGAESAQKVEQEKLDAIAATACRDIDNFGTLPAETLQSVLSQVGACKGLPFGSACPSLLELLSKMALCMSSAEEWKDLLGQLDCIKVFSAVKSGINELGVQNGTTLQFDSVVRFAESLARLVAHVSGLGEALGAERTVSDEEATELKVASKQFAASQSIDDGLGDFFQGVRDIVNTKAQELQTQLSDVHLSKVESSLKEALEGLTNSCGGAADGKYWAEDFEDDGGFMKLYSHAESVLAGRASLRSRSCVLESGPSGA